MMVRMQIQFTEEQVARLRAESERYGVSMSEIVRRRCDSAPPLFPDRSKALASFGSFSSVDVPPAETLDDEIADALYEYKMESRKNAS